jgi:hypothetical protein
MQNSASQRNLILLPLPSYMQITIAHGRAPATKVHKLRLHATVLRQKSEYIRPEYCLSWDNTLYSKSCLNTVRSPAAPKTEIEQTDRAISLRILPRMRNRISRLDQYISSCCPWSSSFLAARSIFRAWVLVLPAWYSCALTSLQQLSPNTCSEGALAAAAASVQARRIVDAAAQTLTWDPRPAFPLVVRNLAAGESSLAAGPACR